ncbi:PTS sugar transporter subunit IIB [Erysipelothrix sp. HDW6C]|uniref:PTS system mannose/fructose/N-acetylgalactosamine-transporter subunit IIB n=1 Tax=Erysipelothrix sp. HDW6C TaxID=2714930 RepID=UPI00140B014D|nr:PTS sugar transporter subunit IIB [Erysipelothrix sp. HDW6C]QIK70681.1 PTS sugar transporter subunit IIB [Erysipelothrix sp. HDW6C]
MGIIHTRIDDRLIHGQVATMWTNSLRVTRIMVVDDAASQDDILKMSLKLACPNGVALSVLSIDNAAERIKAGNYEGQRVFLIIKSTDTLLKLLDKGVAIDKVNVGNLTFTEGKTKIANTVAVTDYEILDFHKIMERGVDLTLQLIPSNPSENLKGILEKLGK